MTLFDPTDYSNALVNCWNRTS